VRAFLDLGASAAVAMHFGTFQLTEEAIDAPPEALGEAVASLGLDPGAFRVPGFGETLILRGRKLL